MLNNFTIKFKLNLSFILIVILIAVLAVYSIYAINNSNSGFSTYRGMAKNTVLSSRVQSNLLMSRMNVLNYLLNKDEKYLDGFNTYIKKTENFINNAENSLQDNNKISKVKETAKLLNIYKTNFVEVISLEKRRDDLVKNILYKNGKKIEQTLTLIMNSEEKKQNIRSSLDLAKTIRIFLLARLYTTRFLEENSKESHDRVLLEFKNLDKNLKKFENNLVTEYGRNNFIEIENLIKKYKSSVNEIYDVVRNKNNIVSTKLSVVGPKIDKLTEDVKLAIKKEQDTIGPEVEKLNKKTESIIIIISVVILFLAIALSIFLPRGIIKSLNIFQVGLLDFFKYLNRQIDNAKLINLNGKDEFSVMAKTVNENIRKTELNMEEDKKLINETITVLSEFEQGDLCQRLNLDVSNPALMQLKDVLNKMADNLENNIDNVLTIIEEYSSYNYLNKISTNSLKEHLYKLANGVNNLGDSITEMLCTNKTNGLTLESSSQILLSNVDKLNLSTNEAASSLEETAAALEEITSNIRLNTNSIVEMSSLSKTVTNSVNEGQKLASETTIAMEEINREVEAINEAITIIDQIAFQTNILSLNAAVEAATAGEAGKGFAVVAQEVRNLASRSAEAASEIKNLVENATQKANHGKSIAGNMIKGYKNLNENISKTIDLIDNVESASKEQLQGIEQINDAVNQLDQQTQENASIATEAREIASSTDQISKLIVNDADEKEFIGKNELKVKKVLEKKQNNSENKNKLKLDNSEEWEDF